jgi:uncharacterized protein DUF6687
MRYLPYEFVGGQPNVIVGGNPTLNTVLHLSQAEGNHTPSGLKADLLSEMVFKLFLQEHELKGAEGVSSDLFNADSLAAIFALTNIELAKSLSSELTGLARAALFEKGDDQACHRIAAVLAAWMDPELSPLKQSVFANPPLTVTNVLYEELLPRLPNIIERVDYLERYWAPAEKRFLACEEALAAGAIHLTEKRDLDLVIIESDGIEQVSCQSIHNRSDRMRVLLLGEDDIAFYYRYESGIESRSSAAIPERIDLRTLAESLTRREKEGNFWRFGPLSATKPYLRFMGVKPSQITKEAFKTELLEVLSNVVT